MRPIIKLLKPDTHEVFLYLAIGIGLMMLSNFQRFWDYVSGGINPQELLSYDNVASKIQDRLLSLESSIDPRLADFTAWLVIGVIAVVVIMVSQKVIDDSNQDIKEVSKLKRTKYKDVAAHDAFARWALRLAGLIFGIIWFRLFFGVVYQELSRLFFDAAVNILSPFSIITMIYTIFLTGFGIYVFVICARLMALKIRVLSK